MGIGRTILAVVVTAALLGLFTFARGDPSHSRGDPGTAAAELRLSA
jgi:hypothetical protein